MTWHEPSIEEREVMAAKRQATMSRYRVLRRRRLGIRAGLATVAATVAVLAELGLSGHDHRSVVMISPSTSQTTQQGHTTAVPPTTTSRSSTAGQAPQTYPPIPPLPELNPSCIGRTSDITESEAKQIQQVIATTTPGIQSVAACLTGPVLVILGPGEEMVAAQLQRTYGKNVDITVGLTLYNGSPGRSPRCGALPSPTPLPSGLGLSLQTQLDHTTVASGQDFEGQVVVKVTEGHLAMDPGSTLQAVLVRPMTRQVVGVFDGAIGGTGDPFNLTAGQSWSVGFVGGTARCDGGIGSALPPGTYQVIVRMAPEGQPPQTPVFWTPPVTIHVT